MNFVDFTIPYLNDEFSFVSQNIPLDNVNTIILQVMRTNVWLIWTILYLTVAILLYLLSKVKFTQSYRSGVSEFYFILFQISISKRMFQAFTLVFVC